MSGKRGRKRRVRIVQPTPRLDCPQIGNGGPAYRPRRRPEAAELADEPARCVPREGLLSALIPYKRAEQHPPIIDAVRAPGARVTFCGAAQVLSLLSAGCLAIVGLALER